MIVWEYWFLLVQCWGIVILIFNIHSEATMSRTSIYLVSKFMPTLRYILNHVGLRDIRNSTLDNHATRMASLLLSVIIILSASLEPAMLTPRLKYISNHLFLFIFYFVQVSYLKLSWRLIKIERSASCTWKILSGTIDQTGCISGQNTGGFTRLIWQMVLQQASLTKTLKILPLPQRRWHASVPLHRRGVTCLSFGWGK